MIIGITGSLGSGKSTVAQSFSREGFHVIDVDKLYHQISHAGSKIQRAIERHFGKDVIRKDGSVDRQKLKDIVFQDSEKLTLLNRLTHPVILQAMERELNKHRRKDIIIDAPLLIEAGFHEYCDKVIVVRAKRDIQIRRAMRRKRLTGQEAKQILRSQMPFSRKKPYADFIIDNSGAVAQTEKQVQKILKTLKLH